MRLIALLISGLTILGCADRKPDAEPAAEAPAAAPQAQAAVPAAQPPREVAFKREAKLVDKNKAMAENPALIEVENKINASDPITAISQSYFNAASRIHTVQLKHSVDLMKASEDRWPTFEEFEKLLKQHTVELTGLYPWQVYAYDDQTGGISILEDRAEKKRQYEAAGRDYPHDD